MNIGHLLYNYLYFKLTTNCRFFFRKCSVKNANFLFVNAEALSRQNEINYKAKRLVLQLRKLEFRQRPDVFIQTLITNE